MAARADPCSTAAEAGSPERVEEPAQLLLRAGEGAEHLDLQRRRGDQQARRERVGRVRRPLLPRGDHRRGVVPERLERGHLRRGHGRELERRDDADARPARPAQRPEQVRLLVLVAAHRAAVGEHDLGGDQRVRGQPVEAAEDPEPAAERQPGDADGRAAARRDRDAVGVERVVDVAQERAGADRRPPVGDGHGAHRRHVDQHARGRGAPGEAVPAAAHRERQPSGARMGDRLGDLLRSGAREGHRRTDVLEAGEGGVHAPAIKRKATRREPLGEPSNRSAEASRPSGRRAFRPHGLALCGCDLRVWRELREGISRGQECSFTVPAQCEKISRLGPAATLERTMEPQTQWLPPAPAPPAPEPAAAPPPPWQEQRKPLLQRILGPLLVAGALLLKFGKVGLLLLTKAKFLTTSASMLVSVAAYALIWGWKFAAGFVALLFVHEMGHYIQLRREGVKPSGMVFIPFLGAAVAAPLARRLGARRGARRPGRADPRLARLPRARGHLAGHRRGVLAGARLHRLLPQPLQPDPGRAVRRRPRDGRDGAVDVVRRPVRDVRAAARRRRTRS